MILCFSDLSLDLLVQLRSAGVQFAVDKHAHRDEVDSGDEKDDGSENNDDDLYTVLSASKRRPEVTLCFSARYWPEIRGKDAKRDARLRRMLADLSFPADWTSCTGVLRRESEYDYWVTESCAADLFHVDGVAGAKQRLSRFMVDAFRDAYEKLVPREVQRGIDLPTPVTFAKGARSKMVPSTVDRELAALVDAAKRRAAAKDSPTKKPAARSQATPSKPTRANATPVKPRPDTKLAASIRRLQSAGKRVRSDSETEDESTPVQRPRKRSAPRDEPAPSPKKRLAPSSRNEDEQSRIQRLGGTKAPRQRANMPPTPGLEPVQRIYRDTQQDGRVIDLSDDDEPAVDRRPPDAYADDTDEAGIEPTVCCTPDSEAPPSAMLDILSQGIAASASRESSSLDETDRISAYLHHSPPSAYSPATANDSTVSSVSESKDEDAIPSFINTLPRPPPRRSPRRSPMRDERKTAREDEPVPRRSPRRSPMRDEQRAAREDEPAPRRSPARDERKTARDERKTAREDEPAPRRSPRRSPERDEPATVTPVKRGPSRAVPEYVHPRRFSPPRSTVAARSRSCLCV